jgi:hypothetical protein
MPNQAVVPVSTKPAQEGLLVDIKGAAALLGITPWRVRGLIADGELPFFLVGSQ